MLDRSLAAAGTGLLVLLFALLPAPAAAQQDEAIDEIQVTATRRPVEATKVSSALTVVPAEEIRAQTLVTDALAGEVGVFLQQTTVGQGAAIIRGLKGSEILHVVDGLRMNNAIFRNAPTQYLALVAPGTVERMEIVRGSPTSLYGSDAVGGVIQVISRLPRFDGADNESRRELFVAADSAEQSRAVAATLEAGNRERAALLSAGYRETGDRRIGGGERVSPSGFDAWNARAAFVLHPSEQSQWLFDLQATVQPETPRIDELVPGFGQDEPSSSEFFFEPNERYFAHLRHAREDGWLGADWNVDLGWQRINDDRRSRDFGATVRRFEENASDLYGLSVTASVDAGARSWVFGGDVYHDVVGSLRYEVDLASGARSDVQARFPDGATVDQAALFAHATQAFADRHTLTGGLRVSRVAIDLPATPLSPAASVDIEDFSVDLGWLFDLTERSQLVANLGHGFRAPNIFDLGTLGERPGNRFNVPNPDLESERVTQVDLGLRRRGAAWSAEFVVYRLDYTDKIESALTGDTTADGRDVVQSVNLGRAKVYGVEAGLRWHPGGALSGELIVNLTRGEQREADGSNSNGDRIPPVNGRATLDWALDPRLTLSASLAFADAQTRLSPRDVRDSRIDPNGTPGWGAAELALRWQPDETWTVDAGIGNLLDKRYRTHGSGIEAAGRNLYVSALARF